MAKRMVFVAAGLLYVSGAVWLVQSEGRAYRRAVRDRRAALAASKAVEVAAALPAPSPAEPPPTPDAPEPTAPVAKPEPTKPVEPAEPVTPPKPPPPAADPPKREPAPDPPAVKLPALLIAGIADLPPAEESRVGGLLHEVILANHPVDEDSPYARQVAQAVRPLLDLRERKEIEPTITVLDSNEVNAFSHLGGYIYVTRGLFNLAATDEEFRFVVGHELAHIDLRHAQSLVAEATRAGKLDGVGTLQALYHQIAAGYTEAQENEADDWVIGRMIRLEHTKRECLAFLRKFARLAEQQGFRNGGKAPKTGLADPQQDVDNHFRSQPAAWSRLSRLEARFKPTAPPPAPASSARPTAPAR